MEAVDTGWLVGLDVECLVGDNVDFQYRPGASLDTVRLTRGTSNSAGSFPHVAPSDELDVGAAGDGAFQIDAGPITVAEVDNPSVTHTVSFSFHWAPGLIAEPL